MGYTGRLLGSNTQYLRYPLSFFLSEMERMGLRRLDFTPKVPHFFCSSGDFGSVEALGSLLEKHHLQVCAVTPPPYRYAITAGDGEQRQKTEAYYRRCLAMTAHLGCKVMVVDASGACWDLPAAELLSNARRMLRILCAAAQEYRVELLIAPVMGRDTPLIAEAPVLNTAQELQQLLGQVDCGNLGVCLDTNVMSAAGGTIADWFDRLGERTRLVRLCDGNAHGWRAWGDGVLPMERYLRELEHVGYEGDLSMAMGGEYYAERPSQAMLQTLRALGEA